MQTTRNTYNDRVDETFWLLGRLDRTTVTHEAEAQTAVVRRSAFDYDATTGLLSAEIIEPHNVEFKLRTDYFYDRFGNIIRKQLSGPGIPTHHSEDVSYDARGRVVESRRNALGHETQLAYSDPRAEALGLPSASTDPNGLTTTYGYDPLGRTLQETRPDGSTTTHAYRWDSSIPFASRALRTEVQGSAPLTRYSDLFGREIRTHTELSTKSIYTDTAYNALGLIASTTKPYYAGDTAQETTMSYDALKRVRFLTAPDGTITETVYDGLRTHTLLDSDQRGAGAKHQRTIVEKNAKGETVRVTDALGNELLHHYDAVGNLIRTVDPAGNEVRMRYDIRGNKIFQHDPDMGSWKYRYNVLDQLVEQTDANGNRTTFSYDRLGRPLERINQRATGATESRAVWVYDGAGTGRKLGTLHREEHYDGQGRFVNRKTFAYDALSRPMIELRHYDNKWFYTTLEYDAQSRPTVHGRFWRPAEATTDWHALVTTNHYDENGLLVEVREQGGGLWWQADADDRDAAGRLARFVHGNGIEERRSFNAQTGWLEEAELWGADSLNKARYGYSYDRLGNMSARDFTPAGGGTLSEAFSYDALNRLRSATVGTSTTEARYDALGNLLYRSDVGDYLYGSRPHAVVEAGGAQYRYDANGNLTSRRTGDGLEETLSARWNTQNKPISLFAGLEGSTFEYDLNGTRTRQVIHELDEMGQLSVRKKIYISAHFEVEERVVDPTLEPSAWVWQPLHSRVYLDTPAGRSGVYQ